MLWVVINPAYPSVREHRGCQRGVHPPGQLCVLCHPPGGHSCPTCAILNAAGGSPGSRAWLHRGGPLMLRALTVQTAHLLQACRSQSKLLGWAGWAPSECVPTLMNTPPILVSAVEKQHFRLSSRSSSQPPDVFLFLLESVAKDLSLFVFPGGPQEEFRQLLGDCSRRAKRNMSKITTELLLERAVPKSTRLRKIETLK